MHGELFSRKSAAKCPIDPWSRRAATLLDVRAASFLFAGSIGFFAFAASACVATTAEELAADGGDALPGDDAPNADAPSDTLDGGDTSPPTDAPGDAPDAAVEKARYPEGALHSPMSAGVVTHLRDLLAKSAKRRDVFAKIGDSNTVNTGFFHCYSGTDVKLDVFSALETARAWFDKTKADGTRSSFDRTSLAATVGWSSFQPLAGTPSPIEQEITAISPAFAVVMLGTNETAEVGLEGFEKNMRAIVDLLFGLGVVPIFTTIPPRGDKPDANAIVPEMNAVVRAVAQMKQIPMVDLWSQLAGLPAYGLISDGIHLDVYVAGGAHACWLTKEGLVKGQNQRNRVTLDALDRAKRFLLDGAAVEPTPKSLAGAGTWTSPYVVDTLPFVDDGNSKKGVKVIDKYGCSSADESGPEIVYALDLPAVTHLRARVFVDEGVDVDLHALSGSAAASCLTRADKTFDLTAGPGRVYFSVDSFVAAGVEKSGGFRLTIVAK